MLLMTQTVSMTPNNSCISPLNPRRTDASKARLVNDSVSSAAQARGDWAQLQVPKVIVDLLALF